MSVTRIDRPFHGEHVIGISPRPSARVTDWNRRLNLFTGRALSDAALTAEQDGRNGRLALAGQTVSAGVITGLEAALEKEGTADILNMGPGFGICASGEDVFAASGARVPVRSLPVYTTAALLDGTPAPGAGALAARKLGPALQDLIATNIAVPKVGIIVLQPVQIDQLANFDAADPCLEDPTSTAFADEQLLDGAHLIYYAWPDEWLLLPTPGPQYRNRLAFSIFDREAGNAPDQVMPWEEIGLPVALLALDDAFNALFVDRYSVVRQGGRAKRRTAPTPDSGQEFLWQARIQQFAEQVVSVENGTPNLTAGGLAAEFRYLPPTGLLPVKALTFVTGNPTSGTRVSGAPFFSGSYDVMAVPVPLEQLDLIARRCGALADFDMSSPDEVTVAVPVPQIWYERDLLQVLDIDPVFQQTVDGFIHERSIWLKRRAGVRGSYSLLVKAVTGTPATFPDPDPDAVEAESVSDTEIDDTIDAFKTPESVFGTVPTNNPPTVASIDTLKAALSGMAGISREVPQLEGLGLAKFTDLLQAKSDTANDHIDLGFLRLQTDIYRMRQKMLSEEAATRLAVSPALASI
ncbi:MAG: hypothetical protein K0Q64_2216, partial [Nitrobacter vulgaris]|nr:hypothetical protein [Nitrobacter vulgaris]